MAICKRSIDSILSTLNIVLTLSCLCIALIIIFKIAYIIFISNIPFDTDEADHANAGLSLFFALKSLDKNLIVSTFFNQSFYPPINSLFLSISYFLFSPSLFSSRILSIFFALLSALLLTKISVEKKSDLNTTLFALCAFLSLTFTNTVFQENASLCMLELLGVCCVSGIIFFCSLPQSKNRDIALGILSITIFLIKYSFGLMISGSIFASLFLHKKGSLKEKLKTCIIPCTIFVLSLLVWITFTDRASMWSFFVGHPSYAPLYSLENIFFDFRSWFLFYNYNLSLSIFLTLLLVLGIFRQNKTLTWYFSWCAAINSTGLLLLSSTNEVRHFIVAIPCLWYLAVAPLVQNKNVPVDKILQTIFLVILFIANIGSLETVKKTVVVGMEGRNSYGQLWKDTFNNISPIEPTLFIGGFDQIGIEAARWFASATSSVRYSQITIDSYPFEQSRANYSALRKRNLSIWSKDPKFPKDLGTVLKQNYFKQAIVVRKIKEESEAFKNLKLINSNPKAKLIFKHIYEDLELNLFKLE